MSISYLTFSARKHSRFKDRVPCFDDKTYVQIYHFWTFFSKIDRKTLRLYLQSCCFFLVLNFEWYIKKNIFGCIKHKRPFAFHWAKSASCSICFYLFWMVVDWIYTPTSGYTVFISVSPYTVQKEQEYVWRRRWFFAVCAGIYE
jgi:hypothetical protein